nr:MAG TPA: hypothetical protein [Caudoviricetes sp.]
MRRHFTVQSTCNPSEIENVMFQSSLLLLYEMKITRGVKRDSMHLTHYLFVVDYLLLVL